MESRETPKAGIHISVKPRVLTTSAVVEFKTHAKPKPGATEIGFVTRPRLSRAIEAAGLNRPDRYGRVGEAVLSFDHDRKVVAYETFYPIGTKSSGSNAALARTGAATMVEASMMDHVGKWFNDYRVDHGILSPLRRAHLKRLGVESGACLTVRQWRAKLHNAISQSARRERLALIAQKAKRNA